MRAETVAKFVFYTLVAAAFYATFARLAYGGADIPPQWGGYYPPPVVRNDCLLSYLADKSFACDANSANAWAGSTQPRLFI